MRMAPSWTATFTVAPRPLPSSEVSATPQQSALNALDSFPSLMVRNGRPVLESGWHEELAVEHQLGPSSRIVASIFRDTSSHTAIFGRGRTSNPDILQDFFSNAFAYDGGESASWGTRVTYRQKLFYDFEAMFLYAFAGALAVDTPSSTLDLRDNLSPRYRHSLGAKLSGRVQKTGTSVSASYKWVNGNNVSRQDPYGEALNQMDPALSLTVRQPLPRFIFAGRMEALADFRNLLAQGYVPVNTPDGQVLLVPMFRTFRGGLSFQF